MHSLILSVCLSFSISQEYRLASKSIAIYAVQRTPFFRALFNSRDTSSIALSLVSAAITFTTLQCMCNLLRDYFLISLRLQPQYITIRWPIAIRDIRQVSCFEENNLYRCAIDVEPRAATLFCSLCWIVYEENSRNCHTHTHTRLLCREQFMNKTGHQSYQCHLYIQSYCVIVHV